MFFRLIPGKNYAFLFMAVVGITILSAYLLGEEISAILFFLSFYYIGILQIQSDAILNRSWTAKSKKGNRSCHIFDCYLPAFYGRYSRFSNVFLVSRLITPPNKEA